MARTMEAHRVRLVMAYAALAAACVGVACTLAAPWLATFFHITTASVEIAAGLVFFIYAVCLVFGIHLGAGADEETGSVSRGEGADASKDAGHDPDGKRQRSDAFRVLLLPFIVSPLGVAEPVPRGPGGARRPCGRQPLSEPSMASAIETVFYQPETVN
jgi:multiple antibiotic resistance protein